MPAEYLYRHRRITVNKVRGQNMTATIQEATTVHVRLRRGKWWSCDCDKVGTCTHIAAVAWIVPIRASERRVTVDAASTTHERAE